MAFSLHERAVKKKRRKDERRKKKREKNLHRPSENKVNFIMAPAGGAPFALIPSFPRIRSI